MTARLAVRATTTVVAVLAGLTLLAGTAAAAPQPAPGKVVFNAAQGDPEPQPQPNGPAELSDNGSDPGPHPQPGPDDLVNPEPGPDPQPGPDDLVNPEVPPVDEPEVGSDGHCLDEDGNVQDVQVCIDEDNPEQASDQADGTDAGDATKEGTKTAVAADRLPFTGAGTTTLLALALGLLVAGAAAVRAGTARR